MPRPKSELTKNRRFVGIHLTPQELVEWKRLGGQKWIRGVLKASNHANSDPSVDTFTVDLWESLGAPVEALAE